MANADNLKGRGFDSRTTSEQREIAKNGGVASGAARRRKKVLQAAAKIVLDMPVTDRELQRQLERLGVPEGDRTYQMAVMVAMLNQALKGNVKAAYFFRDTIGENPADQLRREELKLSKTKFDHEKVLDGKGLGAGQQRASLAEVIQAAYEARQKREGLAPSRGGDGAQTAGEGA